MPIEQTDGEIAIANPGEGPIDGFFKHPTLYRFAFGAYGWTRVFVWGERDAVERALETAAGWLADNAPGIFSSDDAIEPDGRDNDGNPVDHTYTEAGWIPSWEWCVNEEHDPATWFALALRSESEASDA
jgi:hypothetical protein